MNLKWNKLDKEMKKRLNCKWKKKLGGENK